MGAPAVPVVPIIPSAFVMRTGDLLKLTIPPPIKIPTLSAPIPLIGTSSRIIVVGSLACVVGDETPKPIAAPVPHPYTHEVFSDTPGMGTVKVVILPDNIAKRTLNGAMPLLFKGSAFTAIYSVTVPATKITPAGPIPDPVPVYVLEAKFVTTNTTVMAA